MSRIRSIHPGLFTDEAFMSASAFARLLIIGLWCEAHDDGVFEWKPLTIKARVFPVDAVDVPALLVELSELGFLRRFEAGGKPYGAIRNFRKYQRPKKPNSSGKLPEELEEYVALPPIGSEPVPHQQPTRGEKSPRMEDGGWRMEEKGEEKKDPSDAIAPVAPAKTSSKAKRQNKAPDYHGDFVMLWVEFPRHPNSSKSDAYAAWLRLPEEDRDPCFDGARLFARRCAEQRTEERFIPHLATWINGRRFETILEAAE